MSSAVTHLTGTLPHGDHPLSPEKHDEVDRIGWHDLSGRLDLLLSARHVSLLLFGIYSNNEGLF